MDVRPSRAFVVFIACANVAEAARIGRALVSERLAACVNIVEQVRSIFRWKEAIEEASECLMVIKSRRSRFAALEKRVLEMHSYEVPEVIGIPIAAGSGGYMRWLVESATPLPPARPKPRRPRDTRRRVQ